MSGIYIPGMEMPRNGFCIQIVIDDDGKVYSSVEKCILKMRSIATAVPVPPHGRLGDLDKLEQTFVDIDNAPYSGFDGSEPFYSAEDAAQIIRLAPTIVPAEPSEEQREYEAAVEAAQYCEMYEPSYDPETGAL